MHHLPDNPSSPRKQDWRQIGEDWGVGPMVRTQEMAPNMTPRTFKVHNGKPVAPAQLLPKKSPRRSDREPAGRRIGSLYTPWLPHRPRLIATSGLPVTGVEPASGTTLATARRNPLPAWMWCQGGRRHEALRAPGRLSLKYGTEQQKENACLPAEWFDNTGPEDPSAWLSARDSNSIAAKSRYLSKGVWEWRQCAVVGYTPSTGMFTIRWNQDGSQKNVRRLNLCFDGDDVAEFEKRAAAARITDRAEMPCV